MKIFVLLLIFLSEEEPLYYSNFYEIYASWDSINFYIKIKVKEFNRVYLATGNGEEGEYFFPELRKVNKFPVKLNNFLMFDIKENKSYITDKRIIYKLDTLENNFMINFKLPIKIYDKSQYVYFWIGLEIKGDFYSIPEKKENIFPVFSFSPDKDFDGKWDKGVNIKAITRVIFKGEEEEELTLKELKKFFNPEKENLEIVLEGERDLNNIFASVYSLTGKKIRDIDVLKSGKKVIIIWDGRDESGKIQRSGVYLIVVMKGNETWAQIPVVIFK
ncbi:MAG: hypothetical protein ABIN23_07085 [candidate division WOR-3 bacterium]